MVYVPFANEGQSNADHVIPDFSYAGYKGGGVALPYVEIVQTIEPDTGDMRAIIQSAIDDVGSMPPDRNGFRGAILLKAGRYEISDALLIRKSGIVLRGEDQNTAESGGTELVSTTKKQHSFIRLEGSEVNLSFKKLQNPAYTPQRITSNIPSGTNLLHAENAALFSAGDTVHITRTPNDAWIHTLDMAQYGWNAEDYYVRYERMIKSITGNTIEVHAPLVQAIEENFGGGEVRKVSIRGRIQNCGIENMFLTSEYAHDNDENHAWNAICINASNNCWVRNVTARYFGYSCVNLHDALRTTIEECAMLDPKSITKGGRKYSFVARGSFNLFQRCFTRGGRHDYVTHRLVAGPNVFVDCLAKETCSDIGPHHRYATGILFDNIKGGDIRVRNRKDSGTGHGWAGAQTMFWNCHAPFDEITVESPIGARNWGIGCCGKIKNGTGYWESWCTPVKPRSLYYRQLEDRLGPEAVKNVTISQQRGDEPIWMMLENWAGMGNLSKFP